MTDWEDEPVRWLPESWRSEFGTPQQLLAMARSVNSSAAARILAAAARKVAIAQDIIDADAHRPRVQSVAAVDVARIESGFDPSGCFVYCLWGRTTDPGEHVLYIGRSANILARLGSHIGDAKKREVVTRVSLLKCADFDDSVEVERELIARYSPPWNRLGVRRSAS